ncbi:PepSY domain-containing protein [Peteryoungia ipomoeae]|uniref:Peptidase M4 n=1 Tax=Peteryoungia ipomoeae TaxID=1210932 RepID=A0A4S8P9S3_9HYPH|nr:PepSY domain-containing protein [Peteryoungia ipomoeae]THV24714.1 peptidase M4 [Peteryoungia ipomoeae]
MNIRAPTFPVRLIGCALICTALILTGATRLLADDDDNKLRDKLRQAVERGEILSLSELRGIVSARVPGRIIDTELDEDDDRFIYEFRVLTPRGLVVEIEVDAAEGRILEIDED